MHLVFLFLMEDRVVTKIVRYVFILIFAFSLSSAYAQNKVVVVPIGGKGYEPQNPIVISAADFRSIGFNTAYYFDNVKCSLKGNSAVSSACVVAPAYIPNGVTVTKFTGLVYDNDASNSVIISLNRRSIADLTSDGFSVAGVISSESTSPQELNDTTINYPLIDTENYVYYIYACFRNSSNEIYAVKIHYQK